MTGYAIKVYMTDGSWGYPRMVGGGFFTLSPDVNDTMFFDTVQEAKDYYYSHIKGCVNEDTGAAVDSSKCAIVQVSGNCF